MLERLLILWHFAATRWLPEWGDREARRRRFLDRARRESPYYKSQPDGSWPVLSKSDFLAQFEKLNRPGITLEQATEIALRAERERDFRPELPGGITVGLSSGTSGWRHVFLAGRGDRCRWAGQILARMLSPESLRRILNPFAPPLRIGFVLRANSNLYATLANRRVRFDYHDLTKPFGELLAGIAAVPPDVLIAPATVLAELARAGLPISPRQVISVAEVLDTRDRAAIESAFGLPVAEIYQAAEGFLGCTCERGRMHLNEETIHFEREWIGETRERFYPVITDFARGTQWFIRHRLTDILRIDPEPCPCGRRTQTLLGIEGRAEEVLWLPDEMGKVAPVFPDVLRQALYSMPDPPANYRIEQHGLGWEVHLDRGEPDAVRSALTRLLEGLRLRRPGIHFLPWAEQPPSEKQERIRCVEKPT